MSKSVNKVRVPVSPDYRTAPSSLVDNVIGLMIIIAMGVGLLFASDGDILLGALTFFGAIIAYVSVTIARNAR